MALTVRIALLALVLANERSVLGFRYLPAHGLRQTSAAMFCSRRYPDVRTSSLQLVETRSASKVKLQESKQGDMTFESLQETVPPLMLNVMFGISAVVLVWMVLNGYSLTPLGTLVAMVLHFFSVVPNYLLRAGKKFGYERTFTLESKDFVYPSIAARLGCTALQWFFNRFSVLLYECIWVFRSGRFFHQSIFGLRYINAQTGRDIGWKKMFLGVFLLGHFGPFLAGGLAGGTFGLLSAMLAPAGSQGAIAEMIYFGKAGSILIALLLSILNILHAFWDDKNRFFVDKILSIVLVYDDLNPRLMKPSD